MSKATVKKALKSLDKEEVINIVMELYAARKDARDYLEFWVDPDIDRELENSRHAIQKIFFLPNDRPRRKPVWASAKTIINNFKSLCAESDKICDLLIFYAETIFHWLVARNGMGVKSNKTKLITAIDAATREVSSSAPADASFEHRVNILNDKSKELFLIYENNPSTRRRSRFSYFF